MNFKTLFTLLLLSTSFLSYSQKQKIKCTNILMTYPDDSWLQLGAFVGLMTADGSKLHFMEFDKGVYTTLKQFKDVYSSSNDHIASMKVSLAGGGHGFIFKGHLNSDEIRIEMYAEFPKIAYSVMCIYPKIKDKLMYPKIIKALSSIEIDETIEVDITENLEYFVDWKKEGFKATFVSYPSYPYNTAATLFIELENKSKTKFLGLDLTEPEIDIIVREVPIFDLEPEVDSLSQLENKKNFTDLMVQNQEKKSLGKFSHIKSEEVKFAQGKSYRRIIEISSDSDTSKVYQIYQYFWVDDRVFEMKGQIKKLDVNLEKFEELASTFKLL